MSVSHRTISGPRLRVEASCSACEHVESEPYRVQGDSGHTVRCNHPRAPKDGNAAGPLRNRIMLEELKRHRAGGAQVLCVAFPGGTGTAGMVRLCREAGVEVIDG